jgi:sigma-E factor negative regulatory protein RseB
MLTAALPLLATCCVVRDAQAEHGADARDMVRQMAMATKTLSYDGTFVYLRGNNLTSMRVIHKGGPGGERERLISTTGTAKEVIRTDQEVQCFFPGDRSVMVEKRHAGGLLGPGVPQPIEKVSDNYDYRILGGDRVAGRPTWVIGIESKRKDLYGYRLWIDTTTKLMLKSEALDSTGSVLEQVLYTEIAFPKEISDELLKPSVTGQGYTWHTHEPSHQVAAEDVLPKWQVQWLPEGFSMQGHQAHELKTGGEHVDHMVFTDGLATVSVFFEKLKSEKDKIEGLSTFGAVNTFSTVTGPYQVTVVGELPSATIQRIASSVLIPISEP